MYIVFRNLTVRNFWLVKNVGIESDLFRKPTDSEKSVR